ncbi:3D domain-containing protein [Paenibacillus sp. MMO-177]|uniref:3D domain-containing protein n=1 Tax=Paenibacillus sp. MMO-177 TaxID=3081289 RepID=UPI00301AD16E
MAKNWRPVAAIVALLVVTIIGGCPNGKEAGKEGVRPQATGSTAQRIEAELQTSGRGAAYVVQKWGRHGRNGSELFDRTGSEVPQSLGSGKADKPGKPSGLGNGEGATGESKYQENNTTATRGILRDGVNDNSNNTANFIGEFTITAYTAGYESTQKKPGQKGYGITYSGTTVKEGRTIAADLDVLPVGTRVYIDGVGERTIEDRGGGVRGQHIDLYIAKLADAKAWGKQKKKVYVIEWGKRKND